MEKVTGTAEKILVFLMGQDRTKIWDLAPHKEKRTLSQNAYYWQLLGKTADALRISKPELHNRMLRDCPCSNTPGTNIIQQKKSGLISGK